jgi:hypothetical protein
MEKNIKGSVTNVSSSLNRGGGQRKTSGTCYLQSYYRAQKFLRKIILTSSAYFSFNFIAGFQITELLNMDSTLSFLKLFEYSC